VTEVAPDAVDLGEAVNEKTHPLARGRRVTLKVSRHGEIAAVARTFGRKCLIVDLKTGQVINELQRDGYHEDVSAFPLAFCNWNGRLVIIHGTAWNRLDLSDAKTGELLTSRQPTSYKHGEPKPAHDLDYFHSELSVSPDEQFIVDNGWCWGPVGVVTAWSIPRWLKENVRESEDGPSKRTLCWRHYYWDGPLCWIDNDRIAVWGYGKDDEWLIPAIRLFDVRTGNELPWFAGPEGRLVFDEYLFAFDPKGVTTVWDIETGKQLLCDASFRPIAYHPRSRHFISLPGGPTVQVSRLVHDAPRSMAHSQDQLPSR
jgi:hypothetical protein